MTRYTATAKNLAGLLDHEPETDLSRCIEKAIVDAVMEEREACASIADSYGWNACGGDAASLVDKCRGSDDDADDIAAAIRSRGDV